MLGTFNLCKIAAKENVRRLVLISTDKAVRPTNIMGATKRLAELVCQGFAKEYPETIFSMVRFGNVINSSGSVIPMFRDQISNGGPVTITHKDITRYFMTIPEAASLVISAGINAVGGEVFLLDMGKQIRVYDLAERMIRLSGRSVSKEKDDGGEKRVLLDGMKERAKQTVQQVGESTSTGVSKSLKKKSMNDMKNAAARKKKLTNPPFRETDEEVQNALKKKKKELKLAFL